MEAIKEIINIGENRKTYNVEIVIQDNSDDRDLEEKISALGRSNIKYNYHAGEVSFVDNFSEAVSFATGKYLCMIGDDDGILPTIFDAIKYMENNSVDAFIPSLNSFYVWPMKDSFIKNGDEGYLCVAYIENGIESVSCEESLNKVLKNGGQLYQSCDLPRLYHGIVLRSVIEKIKAKTGCYFGGLTPDIYMATALALVCENVVKCKIPVTISGVCTGSGSANSATGKHTGKLEDAPHFVGHSFYQWSDKVPRIYSVETIWADTLLHALDDFGYEHIDRFSISALLAFCYCKYPQFKTELDVFVGEQKVSGIKIILKKIKYFDLAFIKRAFKRVTRRKNDVVKYYGVVDIEAARKIICEQMTSARISVFADENN